MIDLTERLREGAPQPSHPLDADLIAGLAERRSRRRKLTVGAAVLGVVLAMIAGAVALQQQPDRESLDVVGVADPLEGVSADSWVRLMGRLPNTDGVEDFPIEVVDVARARAAVGIEPLPSGAGDVEVAEHLGAVLTGIGRTGVSGDGLGPAHQPISSSQLRAELGFGLEDIDQRIRAGTPPNQYYVATGRFDKAAIDAAVRNDPRWGPRLELKQHRGFEYYSWGADLATSPDITPVRTLGQGGRLVVGDGWVSWTIADAAAEATIDAFLDPRSSIATVPWMRAVTEASDGESLSVVAIIPTGETGGAPGVAPTGALLDPPRMVSIGEGNQPGEEASLLALVYPDDGVAAANATALAESLTGIIDSTVDVIQAGQVLLATLPSGRPVFDVYNALIFRPPTDLERPELPSPRPTQAEILADGEVTDDEYEIAFWTYVECAEAGGAKIRISRTPNGRFDYSINAGAAESDLCYRDHFFDVDREWQIANE